MLCCLWYLPSTDGDSTSCSLFVFSWDTLVFPPSESMGLSILTKNCHISFVFKFKFQRRGPVVQYIHFCAMLDKLILENVISINAQERFAYLFTYVVLAIYYKTWTEWMAIKIIKKIFRHYQVGSINPVTALFFYFTFLVSLLVFIYLVRSKWIEKCWDSYKKNCCQPSQNKPFIYKNPERPLLFSNLFSPLVLESFNLYNL